jgi:hypothetical protein
LEEDRATNVSLITKFENGNFLKKAYSRHVSAAIRESSPVVDPGYSNATTRSF